MVQSHRNGPVDAEAHQFSGRHLLSSYLDCDQSVLHNTDRLLAAMVMAVEASGATLLKESHHVFPEGGMTAVMLLSESHASIHTYPEYASCFVDIFTCGDTCKPEEFDRVLRKVLRPGRVASKVLTRNDTVSEESPQICGNLQLAIQI